MERKEVSFAGESFKVAEKIGLMPMMRFAKVAKGGVDSADLDGLAAMYDLLEQCIDPADWRRFEAAADRSRADGDELMGVVQEVFEVLAERPTSRPSASSDGPTSTPQNSAVDSSLRLVRQLEAQGRPDKAEFILMAQEAKRATVAV